MKKVMLIVMVLLLAAFSPAMAQEAEAGIKQESIENIKAESYSYSKIRVSWEDHEDADGYVVYRASSEDGRYRRTYTTDNPEKKWYINTNRTAGKTYWYKVRAYKVIDGKKYYTRYSKAVSAYARPEKTEITDVTYEAPHRFLLEWEESNGATGYQLQVREPDGKWTFCYQWENGGLASKPVYDGESAKWSLYDGGNYEFRVRAFRKVKEKKVYGLYSEAFSLQQETSAEEIEEAMTEYIRTNYPDYEFYDTDLEGNPLTPENGSWGFTWTSYTVSKYAFLDSIMGRNGKHGLETVIDQYISWAFTSMGDGSGYGCPYVREVNGQYQIWMLF